MINDNKLPTPFVHYITKKITGLIKLTKVIYYYYLTIVIHWKI